MFYFPVAKILDQSPVHLVRIEESTKYCAGLTVGISGGIATSWATPIQVSAYPLSYESIFQPDDNLVTQIEFTGGETETITFCASTNKTDPKISCCCTRYRSRSVFCFFILECPTTSA
jgi:hypothetical protein